MKDNKLNKTIGIYDINGTNINPLNRLPYSNEYKLLSKFWSSLPAYKSIDLCINSIINNDIILVTSGTGSGKTVLFPKFVLHTQDYKGKIIVTLPKRIITQYAAEYSAKTLDVQLGEQVGYQFKGENIKSVNTILLYATDGSIISMIKNDPLLLDIDSVIIDEAHERSTQIDILLFLLKNAIKIRKEKGHKQLKLIIMSATLDTEIFKNYFLDFKFDYLFLSGKPNFPIESYFLEKSILNEGEKFIKMGIEIIKNIIININENKKEEGDILFFVTSHKECIDIVAKLSESIYDSFIMSLYSGCFNKIPELKQYVDDKLKYKEINPNYNRRIFIATNVAESSLTIDGIVYIVDSGLEFSNKYDSKKRINIMNTNIITEAQILQRRGRSGRTKNGFCYHLYTKEEMEKTIKYPDPEIKIIDLKNICISLLKLGQDIYGDFTIDDVLKMFSEFIQPPLNSFIINAIDFLTNNNIISSDKKINKLGLLIAESRFDVMDALSLLYAYNYNINIFDSVLLIICIYSKINNIKELFFEDVEKDTLNKFIKDTFNTCNNSEHILLLKIFKKYEKTQKNNSNKFFNSSLIKNIFYEFNKQYKKLHGLFHRYKYIIECKNFNNNNDKIIACFNFGFGENLSINKDNNFYFNNIICDLSKSIINKQKVNKIIFYTNVQIKGKLYLSILSPFLL